MDTTDSSWIGYDPLIMWFWKKIGIKSSDEFIHIAGVRKS